jgi:uridine kinase
MVEDSVIKYILQNKKDKLIVIGIDGLSRSGKTTYVKAAGKILREYNVEYVCLHMDDFIETRSKRYDTGLDQWEEYYYLQWDVEKLRVNLLEKLRVSSLLTLPYYNEEKDIQVWRNLQLPSCGVILIEGVFLQRKEWRDFFDTLIYLECERQVRFSRESISTQTKINKFENRYWKAEEHYLRNMHPVRNADFVISSL